MRSEEDPALRIKRKKRRRWLWLIPGLVLIAGGVWASRVVGSIGSIGEIKNILVDPRAEFPGVDRMTILIAGKDYNHDSKGNEYTTNSRSDTIMLVSADLRSATLTAVGIPRDTRVVAPDGKTGKINATFARGGIKLLGQTIQDTFGVKPDHFVVLKADAVQSIVDALGGVQITVIDRMHYDDAWDNLHIDLPAGTYRINGEQAKEFVRFRKSGDHTNDPHTMAVIPYPYVPSKEEGDFRRMQRQQQLIHAMMTEVTKPGNLLSLNNIIDVGFKQVETDLSRAQLAALARIFKDSSHSGLNGAALPGKDAKVDGIDYWVVDNTRARLMLNWILFQDAQAGRKLTRVVVNGSRTEAKDYADRLKEAGFSALAGRSSKSAVPDSEVVYHAAAFEGMAHDVASALGIANVHKEDADADAFWLPDVKVNLVPATVDTMSASATNGNPG